MGQQPVNGRFLPAFFIIICLLPFGIGSYASYQLIGNRQYFLEFTPDQVNNILLLIYVFGAFVFLFTGAFLISPAFRKRYPVLCLLTGRVIIAFGLFGAFSAFAMTVRHPQISSELLYWGRLGASLFWIFVIA